MAVWYQNRLLTGAEKSNGEGRNEYGQGLYNEFGIDAALGYEETASGDWFHKIGVGWLKKESGPYDFQHDYEIQPASFHVEGAANELLLRCQGPLCNGYAYVLEKKIRLLDSHFHIHYSLYNTGDKPIATSEYCHNFLALDQAEIGPDYQLRFPFVLHPGRIGEQVDPEHVVQFGLEELTLTGMPTEPFFFSHLSGGEAVPAQWELIHGRHKLGIRETGSFTTDKVNLWGTGTVISPELFLPLHISPGQSHHWVRTFEVWELSA